MDKSTNKGEYTSLKSPKDCSKPQKTPKRIKFDLIVNPDVAYDRMCKRSSVAANDICICTNMTIHIGPSIECPKCCRIIKKYSDSRLSSGAFKNLSLELD